MNKKRQKNCITEAIFSEFLILGKSPLSVISRSTSLVTMLFIFLSDQLQISQKNDS